MKKTLSLLLVLAMVLSSFGFAFADDAKEATPAEILNDLGVLKGNASGDLMLDENLKRQDMVVMLSRLLGAEDEAKAFEGETTFADVTDPFYVSYIAWAEAEELTNGKAEGKFGFNEPVTEQQVVLFMLRALGYTDVAWEDVPAKAVELGLVEKDTDLTVDATRERLAVLTLTALKTKVKDSDKTLAEHLELKLPQPAVLEVVEVRADNLKEIKVVFNKDVDEATATDSDNYETDAGDILDITYVEEDNMAVLLLEDAMDNKEDYEITIKGVKDEKATLDVKKEFKAVDNAIPEVVEVVGLGTKAVKVVMSEPVKEAKTTNFKLDGKTVYGNPELAGREIIVNLYKDLSVGEHELTISGLEDFNKFKSLETKHSFQVVEDKELPVVEDVKATLESATVTFSEDVDKATVSRYSIYWKNNGSKVYAEKVVRIAGNKYAFIFGGDNALPVYETTLYISGVKDYSGNKMEAAEVKVKPSIDESRPEVIKVELQKDRKTVVVKFSKSVNEKDAKDLDNYTILDSKDNKQTISEINKLDSRRYEVVLGKALAENKEYTLKISGIRDNNKYPNIMFAYEKPLTVGDYTYPEVEYVSGTWDESKYAKDKEIESTIHVFFSKEMDLGTLSNPENYLVKVGNSNKLLSDVGGDVDIIKSDGTVVLLTVVNKYKVTEVAVLGVKDTTGKKLSNFGVMQEVKAKAFALESATAEAKDEIELEFSMPVAKANRTDFKVNGGFIVKEVEVDGTTVTLKLEGKKLNADNNQVEVIDKEVVSYNGEKLAGTTMNVKDEIAPSIEKVSYAYKAGDANVVVEVVFDEEIKIESESAAKTDLVVKRINELAKVDFTVEKVAKNQLNILIPVAEFKVNEKFVDSAIEVSIVKGARFITDVKENKANEMAERTLKVTGITEATVKPVLDTKELDAQLTKAAAYAGKEAEYTAESWKAFDEALKAAKAVKENAKATQEQVNAAAKALEEAIAGLVKKGEAEKLTADVIKKNFLGADTVFITLSDATKVKEVKEVQINEEKVEFNTVKNDTVISVIFEGTVELTSVKVFMNDGQVIDGTIK